MIWKRRIKWLARVVWWNGVTVTTLNPCFFSFFSSFSLCTTSNHSLLMLLTWPGHVGFPFTITAWSHIHSPLSHLVPSVPCHLRIGILLLFPAHHDVPAPWVLQNHPIAMLSYLADFKHSRVPTRAKMVTQLPEDTYVPSRHSLMTLHKANKEPICNITQQRNMHFTGWRWA